MKETLYLLPGLLCDSRVWAHQQANLADLAEIRIPDFRQYDSLSAMADAVLDAAPERFMLAGHSMGGRIALQILDKAPERVLRLGLLDTGLHPPAAGEADKRQVLLDLAAHEGMQAVARMWTPPMVHPDRHDDPVLMAEIHGMVESHTPAEFSNQIHALLGRPDATPFLAKAPRGTLLLCGRQDTWSPPHQHEALSRALTDHPPVVIIEESGHMSPMEQPAAVTAAMRKWLEQ
jgi:pimeloyl-ACP methyl ester carboxylesterase